MTNLSESDWISNESFQQKRGWLFQSKSTPTFASKQYIKQYLLLRAEFLRQWNTIASQYNSLWPWATTFQWNQADRVCPNFVKTKTMQCSYYEGIPSLQGTKGDHHAKDTSTLFSACSFAHCVPFLKYPYRSRIDVQTCFISWFVRFHRLIQHIHKHTCTHIHTHHDHIDTRHPNT